MGIKLNTAKQAFPMIYAYSTPQIADHNGWTKIGYTEEQDVETRIKQQTHTSDTLAKLEWKGAAIFDDGSGESFTDKAFHAYLRKLGVANKARTEWFHIDGPTGRSRFYDFRADRGILKALDVIPYELRAEQEKAVGNTVAYYDKHDGGEYLWNAKPRFGKTLSVYDFCKRVQARSVLIVTNRPAIANSWYTDYTQFMGEQSGFRFISETDSLKGMLEAENPGCFDDPDKTFIDLYMKSGLYITEIVKRLYQSEQMKKQFPDPKERLRHIFEKQVYGLAPTEIIYHIALSYILGFNEDTKDIKHNFRQLDALPYAKEGTLQQKLDELFS